MNKKAEELMFANLLTFGDEGKITLFEYPAFLFPSEYILKVEEIIEPNKIYELAKHIPMPIIKILTDRKMNELERLDFLLELAEVLGMGSINVPDFQKDNKVHKIIINNSTTNKISCNHTRGYLATVFSDSLKKDFECEEKECISKGNSQCVFILSIKD